MQIAVIDIGSNSIRYMEAGLCGSRPVFSRKEVFTTRLAAGLSESGKLSERAMQSSLCVLSTLARRAENAGLFCAAYATSAVRDADNRAEFLSAVSATAHIAVQVLSGEQEAQFAYQAATSGRGGMLDIGGGSTQIVAPGFQKSFPAGCVRVHDWCGERTLSEMRAMLKPRFAELYTLPSDLPSDPWTAVGGTATTLAALFSGMSDYDPSGIQNVVLTPCALLALLERLDALGDAGRAAIPLLKERHDVILSGGAILLYLMERLSMPSLRFSDADGLEGYAVSLLRGCRA